MASCRIEDGCRFVDKTVLKRPKQKAQPMLEQTVFEEKLERNQVSCDSTLSLLLSPP